MCGLHLHHNQWVAFLRWSNSRHCLSVGSGSPKSYGRYIVVTVSFSLTFTFNFHLFFNDWFIGCHLNFFMYWDKGNMCQHGSKLGSQKHEIFRFNLCEWDLNIRECWRSPDLNFNSCQKKFVYYALFIKIIVPWSTSYISYRQAPNTPEPFWAVSSSDQQRCCLVTDSTKRCFNPSHVVHIILQVVWACDPWSGN